MAKNLAELVVTTGVMAAWLGTGLATGTIHSYMRAQGHDFSPIVDVALYLGPTILQGVSGHFLFRDVKHSPNFGGVGYIVGVVGGVVSGIAGTAIGNVLGYVAGNLGGQ